MLFRSAPVVISIKFSLEVLSLNCILLHSFGFKLLKGKIVIEIQKVIMQII